ncbi:MULTISPECIES: hypothetical protein [Burkholderia cepacia complex]|uniref:hypothetical protein n=1 Tax=Burkholderia cepacia complex TaxID=87882 RepID=UPI001B9BE9FC|nr:hypothetical protein [Burkholderia cenocepacia]MBR8317904.1 hypothetical protein [Burkholderia cenocepacia]MBR8397409.1 hypothetical protein [Burkholderia cenocepacia]
MPKPLVRDEQICHGGGRRHVSAAAGFGEDVFAAAHRRWGGGSEPASRNGRIGVVPIM